MKNISILILFISALALSSCGKSSPQPDTCEQGGEEVTVTP